MVAELSLKTWLSTEDFFPLHAGILSDGKSPDRMFIRQEVIDVCKLLNIKDKRARCLTGAPGTGRMNA